MRALWCRRAENLRRLLSTQPPGCKHCLPCVAAGPPCGKRRTTFLGARPPSASGAQASCTPAPARLGRASWAAAGGCSPAPPLPPPARWRAASCGCTVLWHLAQAAAGGLADGRTVAHTPPRCKQFAHERGCRRFSLVYWAQNRDFGSGRSQGYPHHAAVQSQQTQPALAGSGPAREAAGAR